MNFVLRDGLGWNYYYLVWGLVSVSGLGIIREESTIMSFGWSGTVCGVPTIVDYARLLVPMVEVVLQIKR